MHHNHRQAIAARKKLVVEIMLGAAINELIKRASVRNTSARDTHVEQREIMITLRANQIAGRNGAGHAKLIHRVTRQSNTATRMQRLRWIADRRPTKTDMLVVCFRRKLLADFLNKRREINRLRRQDRTRLDGGCSGLA